MSGGGGRRGAIRAQNEARILAAAEQLFAANGYAGTTTAAIALRAGLPKANVHYYFATKRAIYQAVLERILRLWLSAFEPFTEADDPARALALYIRAKMRHSRDHPLASRIFASEILRGAPEIRAFLEGELATWVARKASVIEAWIAAGRIDPIDPRQLFFLIWATTQHYADFAVQIRAVGGAASARAAQAAAADDAAGVGEAAKPAARRSHAAADGRKTAHAHAATPSAADLQILDPEELDAAADTIVRLVLKGLGLQPPASTRAVGRKLRRSGAHHEALLPFRL